MDLRTKLADWTDFAIAENYIGESIGIGENESWITSTLNKVGSVLGDVVVSLLKIGAIIRNDKNQIKWNSKFDVNEFKRKS
jgi:hypothetical protein